MPISARPGSRIRDPGIANGVFGNEVVSDWEDQRMTPQQQARIWAERADAAEAAILDRHLRKLWALPGTRLGMVCWPPGWSQRVFVRWDYWWQAHLVDCAVDAAARTPTAERRGRLAYLIRGHRFRNLTSWTNTFYDDMAWLGLALERAERIDGLDCGHGLRELRTALERGWNPEYGAFPWHVGSDFFNAPANGPAGILFARLGDVERAAGTAEWMATTLSDKRTGLVLDGIHLPGGRIESAAYTYNQGVMLGLDTELAVRTGEPGYIHRAARLIGAIEDNLTVRGSIDGGGGGDGGLFNGILARYLAFAALSMPAADAGVVRRRAAAIVLSSAHDAWSNRLDLEGRPLFGHDWRIPAQLPGTGGVVATSAGGAVQSSSVPERDLSVQIGGWMLMEAAYSVAAAGLSPVP